jgi:hypothetical protein
VYVATIYTFEKMFGNNNETNYERYGCYNGFINYIGDPPIPSDLFHLIKDYEDLIKRPTSRLDRDSRLILLNEEWSRPLNINFLNSIRASEPLLTSLNPTFKAVIDSWFDIGDQHYLITYLLGTLDNWIRINIDSKSPSMTITMLGLGFREEILSIINFFKPYRARLAFMDTAFSIKNPLTESVLTDELLITEIGSSFRNPIRPVTSFNDPCRKYLSVLCCQESMYNPTPVCGGDDIFDEKNSWVYDETGKPIFKYDIGGVFDVDPSLQMDQDYVRRLTEKTPAMPPGYAGKCSQFRYDIGAVHDLPPLEQMDDEYLEKYNKYVESLNL